MARETFRVILRIVLILSIVASCTEALYFMGELSNKSTNSYNKYPKYDEVDAIEVFENSY